MEDNVGDMGEMCNALQLEEHKGGEHFDNLRVNGRIKCKQVLNKKGQKLPKQS
jgi:hypothetical protein